MDYILNKYQKLFEKSIPEFFARLNKQCLRGNSIGMEIGKLRERYIVSLLQIISNLEKEKRSLLKKSNKVLNINLLKKN